MLLKILITTTLFLITTNQFVFAGAAIQKQQQMKQAQQQAQQQAYAQAYQQAQQQAYAQAVAQQQQQAYAQAVAQQQQAVQVQAAQQYVMQQQAQLMIQAQMNRVIQVRQLQLNQQAQLKQAVQQELAQRVAQQIQQGQAAQIQQAMISQVVDEAASRVASAQVAQAVGAVTEMRAAQTLVAASAIDRKRSLESGTNDTVQDIVDINDLWAKLDKNSKAWSLMIDPQDKVKTVNEYIERYRKQGVRILKSPAYYAQMIEDMSSQNSQMLTKSFMDIVQLVAIMEYDFDNGLDKDMMARKLLGEEFYLKNRKRLGK